jgi:glutathione S-transferase
LCYPIEETGFELRGSHPALFAWTERMANLPGWRSPYELMPGERIPLRIA